MPCLALQEDAFRRAAGNLLGAAPTIRAVGEQAFALAGSCEGLAERRALERLGIRACDLAQALAELAQYLR